MLQPGERKRWVASAAGMRARIRATLASHPLAARRLAAVLRCPAFLVLAQPADSLRGARRQAPATAELRALHSTGSTPLPRRRCHLRSGSATSRLTRPLLGPMGPVTTVQTTLRPCTAVQPRRSVLILAAEQRLQRTSDALQTQSCRRQRQQRMGHSLAVRITAIVRHRRPVARELITSIAVLRRESSTSTPLPHRSGQLHFSRRPPWASRTRASSHPPAATFRRARARVPARSLRRQRQPWRDPSAAVRRRARRRPARASLLSLGRPAMSGAATATQATSV